MVALILVALSVGLDNLGVSAAIGVSGVDQRLRVRVGLVFGAFEGAMPVVGLFLGHSLARDLGSATRPVGGVLLGLVGAYAIVTEFVGERRHGPDAAPSLKRLLLLGAALSIDNLVIGFALGTTRLNIVVAAITIGAVSVAMSLLGLELGNRLSGPLGQRSELVGGAVLVLVGVAVGTGVL